MKATTKQRDALRFIHNHPGASVEEIATAASASTSRSNAADFLHRMIDAGLVQVIVSSEVYEAIENGDL